MQRKIVPGVVDGLQVIRCLGPADTALAAARMLAEHRLGAVLVMDEGRLVGIVTERDLIVRVLAEGRDLATIELSAVMTRAPQTIAPESTALEALDLMIARDCRHLPVVRGEELCGIVSMRDLHEAVRQRLQEDHRSAASLISEDQYGMASG